MATVGRTSRIIERRESTLSVNHIVHSEGLPFRLSGSSADGVRRRSALLWIQ